MMRKLLIVLILFCASVGVRAQVGIGTPDPNPSALLELQASDKGILIPRVELQSTTDAATIANGNVESLLVFNTATVADVQPGYYYWYGAAWHRLAATDQLGNEVVTKLVKNADGSYTYYNETAIDESGNVITGQGVVIDVVGDVVTNIKEQGDIYKEIIGIVNSLSGKLVENNDGTFSLVATDDTVLGTIDKADLTKNTGPEEGTYTFTNNDGSDVVIDVPADVVNNIEKDGNIYTKIIEKLNGVYGNVYFDPTNQEFYYYNDQGDKVVINLKDFVGDKIVNNQIIYTGDSINGEPVTLFKTTTTIAGTVPSAVTAGVTLPETPTGVVSISVYKGGILLTSSVTDMTITGADVAFNLGLGSLYHAFAPGTYEVIIYFTVAAAPAP